MPINVVCVNAGNYCGMGAEYVNILNDSVRRNTGEGVDIKFTCFTDDPEGLDKSIEARPLPEGLEGWWNKLYLFSKGLFPEGERVVYFDLDTLITGRIDEILQYDGEFAILDDFFRHSEDSIFGGWQSGVMAWRSGFGSHLWESFVKAGYPDIEGGDQAWIKQNQETADLLQLFYPGKFVSYKASSGDFPATASVVCFHGHPRPHEVVKGWVPKVFKIGGISRADLEFVCNTQNSIVLENIKAATLRDGIEWFDFADEHDRDICIVGGGPSLISMLPELRARAQCSDVWALNGAYNWLVKRGIIPDAMVIADARPENAQFVSNPQPETTFYVASQCSPEVFDALKGYRVVLFNNFTPGSIEAVQSLTSKKAHFISGGKTVGMHAMLLARLLGYRWFYLYGMDSSYSNGEGHAYRQELNDRDRVFTAHCGDRDFVTAPWMVGQVQDFIKLAGEFSEQGCRITVTGDGLLPQAARMMQC